MRGRLTSLVLVLALVFAVGFPASQAIAAPKKGSTNPFARIPVQGTVDTVTLNVVDFVNNQGQLGAVVDVVNAAGAVVGTVTAPVTVQQATCEILRLELGPLDLNLLGLRIQLNRVELVITAQQGGGLLGDLLCAIANLLNGFNLSDILGRVVNLLEQILNQVGGVTATTSGTVSGAFLTVTQFVDNADGTLGVVGNVTNKAGKPLGTATGPAVVQAASCTILDLELGPLDLNLLGLRIQLSQVNLLITAEPSGGLLGQLLCAIANLLNSGGLLSNLLNQVLGVFQ